ncbi:MAG: response regulator [Burkholderiales bacterium]|nr:response regulator [Burkholderiales bacterium]
MPHAAPATRSPAVLLVEDDAALSGYLAAALRGKGYQVHCATDRASALACMEQPHAPALVLLDLGLPPHPSTMREGLQALQDILRTQPGTKVLVLTGQDEAAAAHEAVRLGAFDFLTKPAGLDSLLQALSRANLFAREEARMVLAGETRLSITARIDEGPKEAGAQVEEQLLRRSLAGASYNVTEAARQLGLAREHVYYYMNKYGIRRPD